MARIGLFGNRTHDNRNDHDGVDDRSHAGRADGQLDRDTQDPDRDHPGRRDAATPSTQPPAADREHDRDGDGIHDRTERYPAVVDRDGDGVDDRDEGRRSTDTPPAQPTPTPVRVASARVSLLATLGLIFGLIGTAAALTGRLAPVAVAVGAIGLLLSFAGVAAGGRPHVAGRGLGSLGVLLSAGAIVLAVLAMTNTASWLSSDVDQVAKLREWIDTQLPWMRGW